MDTLDVLESIKLKAALYEASHVETFTGFRRDKNGVVYELTVEVRDAGLTAPSGRRYSVIATANDRIATGRGDDLEATLDAVDWADLEA
jgi:hypothetical protein